MSHRFLRFLDLPNEFIILYLRDIHRSTRNRSDFEEVLQNTSNMAIALRCLLVDRYSENDFQLEEQELNDLRVSLEDAEHLFEVTISKKLHVRELLCKMEDIEKDEKLSNSLLKHHCALQKRIMKKRELLDELLL
ncbi:hypothetical protein Tco_1000274 [Tanacetum coccineum]